MKNKSLGINAIYNIIYKILSVIFPLISTAYVSRVLLADGVGKVAAVNNNVSYFLIFATLGIPVYGLREIAKKRENYSLRSKLFSELFTMNFILTIATYILFNIIIFTNDYFYSEIKLYVIFGFTILFNIFNVDWLFQGLEEYKYIATRSVAIKAISLILLYVFVKEKSDIYIYALIQVAALTGNYICNIAIVNNYVKFSMHDLNLKKHIKPLAYLALCSISTELYAKMDITMLDLMKGDEIVGYYTNSQKIVNLIVATLVAVTAVFMPRLSFLFDIDKDKFNKILKKGFDLMVTVSIPACASLCIISEPLVLSFLGDSFRMATVTLSILSFMIPLKCIGDLICFQVMMCARQESILMRSYVITMLVNLVNNFILIPRYGAEGASIASVISEILAFVFVLFYSREYFEIKNIKTILVKTIICTCIMCVILISINYFSLSCFIKLALDVIFGMTTFILSCFIIKHEVVLHYMELIKSKVKN